MCYQEYKITGEPVKMLSLYLIEKEGGFRWLVLYILSGLTRNNTVYTSILSLKDHKSFKTCIHCHPPNFLTYNLHSLEKGNSHISKRGYKGVFSFKDNILV
jgi:hypothetical protein